MRAWQPGQGHAVVQFRAPAVRVELGAFCSELGNRVADSAWVSGAGVWVHRLGLGVLGREWGQIQRPRQRPESQPVQVGCGCPAQLGVGGRSRVG